MSRSRDYIQAWEDRKQELAAAEKWYGLREAKDAVGDRYFKSSAAHSSLVLVFCGQHIQGGKNYHESPGELNKAILAIICEEPQIIERAITKLRLEADVARQNAREELERALAEIPEPKEVETDE